MSTKASLLRLLLALLSLVLLAQHGLGAKGGNSTELDDKIDEAADAQSFDEKAETVSQEIDSAPAAKLSAGTGDIETTGKCAEDIEIFCPAVKPGYAHLAECLSNQIADEGQGESEFTAKVTEECKEEITQFKMQLATNINLDVKMARACKEDAKKHCDYTKSLDFPGKVIGCLREKKQALSLKCRNKITQAQIAAAEDYRLDALLYQQCKTDAEKVCKDVKAGSGRVNQCLRDKRAKVSWECQEELFRADVEKADDVRLSVKLFRTCLADKRRFCADVAPGNARVKYCLETNRDKPGFSEPCKEMLEAMMMQRAKDFRLDVRIRQECMADIDSQCSDENETTGGKQNEDSRVIECLQDFRAELSNPECQKAVYGTMMRASEDIRFAVTLAETCSDDRKKYCGNVTPGSARVIRCLQERRSSLAEDCRATLFDHETRMAESIDFQKPMKVACDDEIKKFCKDSPAGHARVIRCLQDHKGKADFGSACTAEVTKFENGMGTDYRLNNRLQRSCEADIFSLCSSVCDIFSGHACGGRVLRCLVENKEKVKAESCKQEIFYFIKMEVSDYGNDVMLAEACRGDVDSLCFDVKGGEGRVHACLRENREKLSVPCRKEELALEIQEVSNIELRPKLKKACAEERTVFCSEVATGQARVFRCLVQNLGQPDFGDTCKGEILRKLARRQQNWRLDVNLRKACKADVESLCQDADTGADKADVLRCLIKKRDEVADMCAREVARSAHMALYVWQSGAALSKVCDDDISSRCMKESPMTSVVPGKALQCLDDSIKGQASADKGAPQPVSPECKALVDVAEPPDEKADYDANLRGVAAMSLKQGLSKAGMWDHHKGVTITGYTAMACFSGLVTTMIMGVTYLYRRWRGIKSDGYVRVVKSGDV